MLKRICNFLFYSCRHKWEIIHVDNMAKKNGNRIGSRYHVRCKDCGKMKFEDSY